MVMEPFYIIKLDNSLPKPKNQQYFKDNYIHNMSSSKYSSEFWRTTFILSIGRANSKSQHKLIMYNKTILKYVQKLEFKSEKTIKSWMCIFQGDWLQPNRSNLPARVFTNGHQVRWLSEQFLPQALRIVTKSMFMLQFVSIMAEITSVACKFYRMECVIVLRLYIICQSIPTF